MDDRLQSEIAVVAGIIADATDILFITGAGVSADSGIPTYRGVGGLYEGDIAAEEGFPIEQVLSGPMFASQPALVWKYLWQIGAACAGAQPNAAHEAIAQLEADKENVWVITQNVDGLHRAAGTRNLIEVHGHAFDLFCTACDHPFHVSDLFDAAGAAPTLPPTCDDCGGIVRPNVVLFEEALPEAALEKMYALAETRFDVVVSIGTSMMFPYIHAPIHLARAHSIPAVEINPCKTSVSEIVDHRIPLGAAEAMNRIMTHT